MRAYTSFGTKKTDQSEPIPGANQVKNNAGGYVYTIDDMRAFERFLILGSEGGTFYVKEKELTKQNALKTIKVIQSKGIEAVNMIVEISDSGRAPKNDPAIFALAIAASLGDLTTKQYALAMLPKVCRIPTHLFHFLTYVKQFRGFGRSLKRAVANWYQDMPVEKLAYEVIKYQSRDGWSNADALRLSHPKTYDEVRNAIYRYVVDGIEEVAKREQIEKLPKVIAGFELAKDASTKEIVGLIRDYNLSREMLPTEALTKAEVWEALLPTMPYTALIRNLGNLSKCGLLKPMSEASKLVCQKLLEEGAIKRGRIHPAAILIAMRTYDAGKGMRGKGEWEPVPAVVDALDDAFYLAFDLLEPTGKRMLFGIDVSGSMTSQIAGLPISAAEAAAAMAMACIKKEREYHVMGFTAGTGGSAYHHYGKSDLDGFVQLGFTPKMTLKQVLDKTRGVNFGATDCALPMIYAEKNKLSVDAFIVITDNETWAGQIHPKQALKSYRDKMGIQAKQIVMGTAATDFTIADPSDPLTLDVVGFDASAPNVVTEFIRG